MKSENTPKQLTLADRYYLSMYSRRLPCTLELRFAIDSFLRLIQITEPEVTKFAIDIDKETHEFKCNDDAYSIEYTDIPDAVVKAMKEYVTAVNAVDKTKQNNELIIRTADYFKKLI